MKTERDVDKKGVGKKSSSKQYDLNKKKDIKESVDKVDDSEEASESATNHVVEKTAFEKIENKEQDDNKVLLKFQVDIAATLLFFIGLATRLYKLEEPRSVVFDELHYGKYISLYLNKIFFFDSHPPLGKQLVSLAAYLSGFDGQLKFEKIGSAYGNDIPLFTLRFVPAFCGSLLVPTSYHLLLELGLKQWTAILAGFLLICDNALLTQSRFLLMESILLFFNLFGLLCILKFKKQNVNPFSVSWWLWLILAFASLTCSLCVKYIGVFSYLLGLSILFQSTWEMLGNRQVKFMSVVFYVIVKSCVVAVSTIGIYLLIFYIHLSLLSKAGPHDSVMTSAFQASLEGGLASITKGQPLEVGHGSQITLRHTFGRTCWLHSHAHVYPLRYPDKRGSSHQQQVTCYSFKDVNNWWIVKRPDRNDLMVSRPVDVIHHGDVIQLVHGITSRALNSHDVAAPMSPQNQEVSCYVDYNVSMAPQNLWKVDIVNREQIGDVWLTIQSQVRLIHVNSSQALKFSGRQLPDWGFNQHEIVTDRIVNQPDSVWNVEEHRYTKSDDQKERERDMVNAEMIPTQATVLTFWEKMMELQYKMLFAYQEPLQSHMYSSDPLDWPLLKRTTAYWVSQKSNAQIHLLGNIMIWYSGAFAIILYIALLVFYLLRRRRHCFDLPDDEWTKFCRVGQTLTVGYFIHYVPYFFMDNTLFLHHYLPAFIFKVMILAAVLEHSYFVFRGVLLWPKTTLLLKFCIFVWCISVIWIFNKFSVLSYGTGGLNQADLVRLRWRDTWHFIVHKE
ncbi:hypothetical protein RUM43_006814 [Polyplax serrata]|uniref:Protein O-mannosyltransferase 1 n=1 Tax=Polyplax serrata TaxID=468196 RepID=A0AAN8PL43_POLSC